MKCCRVASNIFWGGVPQPHVEVGDCGGNISGDILQPYTLYMYLNL